MLTQPYRNLLFEHMRKNAVEKNIYIDRLNGYLDHVHCLVWLKKDQKIEEVAKLLKGEASFWFNKELSSTGKKLLWQRSYFAVSVSLHMVERVRGYIDRQEEHHKRKTFKEAYDRLMKQCLLVPGFEADLSDSGE